jgi:hypothetical protein
VNSKQSSTAQRWRYIRNARAALACSTTGESVSSGQGSQSTPSIRTTSQVCLTRLGLVRRPRTSVGWLTRSGRAAMIAVQGWRLR